MATSALVQPVSPMRIHIIFLIFNLSQAINCFFIWLRPNAKSISACVGKVGHDANSRYCSLKQSWSLFEIIESFPNGAVTLLSKELLWRAFQLEETGQWSSSSREIKKCGSEDEMGSCDLSAVSMASLRHHLSAEYLAASEWVNEWVSEWVSKRVGEIFFKENEEEDLCHIS